VPANDDLLARALNSHATRCDAGLDLHLNSSAE